MGISALHLSSGVDPVAWSLEHTKGIGVDGVLITAATSSTEPVHFAAQACRQRGRIILIGVTGELRRDPFTKGVVLPGQLLHGPGRYDSSYEQHAMTSPFVLHGPNSATFRLCFTFATGALSTDPLITHRFSFDQASDAYELLSSSEPPLHLASLQPNS